MYPLLGRLANVVATLIRQPYQDGLDERRAFNLKPLDYLGDPTTPGGSDPNADERVAFLNLKRKDVALQVLNSLRHAGHKFDDPAQVGEFVLWLHEFALWEWGRNEDTDANYPRHPDYSAYGKAQYTDPDCHIDKAVPINVAPKPGVTAKKVTLKIFGEGFLLGGSQPLTIVKIFRAAPGDPPPTADPPPAAVFEQAKEPEAKSTFRGGVIIVEPDLEPGDYWATVHTNVGGGKTFPIVKPEGAARFTVPQ